MLFLSSTMFAADFTINFGGQITPDRVGLSGHLTPVSQTSKPGIAAGFQYRILFSKHQGFEAEATLTPTNTQLGHNPFYTWQMERVSINGSYVYRFLKIGSFTPFARAGLGTSLTASGSPAPGAGGAPGWDDRFDKIVAAGMDYQLTEHLSFRAEYEAHFLLNQDFADTSWTPAQNVISEPKIGLTWRF
jgi:opacity protein-like surface antigen